MRKVHSIFILRKQLLLMVIMLMSMNMIHSQENIFKVSQIYNNIQSVSTGNGTSTFQISDPEIQIPNHVSIRPKAYLKLTADSNIGPYQHTITTINVTLNAYLSDGSIDSANPITRDLVVEYNPHVNSSVFADRSYFEMLHRYGIQVQVNSVTTQNMDTLSTTTNVANDNISFEVGFECERYYLLTEQLTTINPMILTENTEFGTTVASAMHFIWQPLAGATAYELEWTWVDNYGIPGDDLYDGLPNRNLPTYLNASAVNLSSADFEKNCTKISTKNTVYQIPLVYADGFIVYRVRGVGRFMDDPSKSFFGEWSSGASIKTKVADWEAHYYAIQAHEKKKNWQFQSSYAEEGKKKEVVSYFDGSLRNRQTVTKVNTDNNAVVGEQIYDNQGRAAIEILPVPLNGKHYLRYFNDLNRNSNSEAYSHKDFDWDTDANCNVNVGPMLDTYGSSLYYSENNDFTGFTNIGFVPNAYRYPFSQTEYTPDNTGRIKSKGGVGKAHQLNSGHEMRYYYTTPAQEELNRLFGPHVGYSVHYKKNIAIDPNGQASVSYIDPQGKTIATALAGGSPASLDPLEQSEIAGLTIDLLNNSHPDHLDTPTDNNILGSTYNFSTLKDKLTFSKEVIVLGNNISHSFNYSLLNSHYFLPDHCSDKYEFVYDLKLSLKDECADEKYPILNTATQNEYVTTLGNQYIGATPGTINPKVSIPLNSDLDTGAHSLVKELSVNEETLNYYAEEYIRRIKDEENSTPGCYIAPGTFAVPASLLSDCFTTCEECRSSLGLLNASDDSPNAFVLSQLTLHYNNPSFVYAAGLFTCTDSPDDINGDAYIPQTEIDGFVTEYTRQWEELKKTCDMICYPSFASRCSIDEKTLMADMSPGGQYGGDTLVEIPDGDDNNTPVFGIKDTMSVFNSENTSGLYQSHDGIGGETILNDWRNLPDGMSYLDEQGNVSMIEVMKISDNQYNPEIVSGATLLPNTNVGPNGEMMYKVKPQDLKKVSDFLFYWKTSWAAALLPYHPEYHYLKYSKGLCAKTRSLDIINAPDTDQKHEALLSTDEYDGYLQYLTTYQSAVNAGFADDTNGIFQTNTYAKIMSLDPFFESVLVGYEEVNMLDHRSEIMKTALFTNYEEHGNTLLTEAYKMVLCNAVNDCTGPFVFSNLTTAEKDRLWNTYKSLYLSLKARLQYVCMNVYAAGNGALNECVGPDPLVTITNCIGKYPHNALPIFVYMRLIMYGKAQICYLNNAHDFMTKQKRFIPIDTGYDSGSDAASAQSQLAAMTAYEMYAQTGICPALFELEIFMDGFFNALPVASLNNLDQPVGQYLTAKLFKGFTGLDAPLPATSTPAMMHTAFNPNNKTIQFSFTNITTTVTNSLSISIPNTGTAASLNWSNLGTTWQIIDFKRFYYNGPGSSLTNVSDLQFAFNAIAVVKIGTVTKEIILSGFTSAKIGECRVAGNSIDIGEVLNGNEATSDQMHGCNKKYKFRLALLGLLNELRREGHLFPSTPLELKNYMSYSRSYLADFFGEADLITTTWVYDSGTFRIMRGTTELFSMSVAIPATEVFQFDSLVIGLPQTNATLFYTDIYGVSQNIAVTFDAHVNLTCCDVEENIVPTFVLRRQFNDTDPDGDLLYSDMKFTPKNISVRIGQDFTVEFSVDKTINSYSFEPVDWKPEVKLNSVVYNLANNNLHYEKIIGGELGFPIHNPINKLSDNDFYGALFEIDDLEYNINGFYKKFLFNGNTKSTDDMTTMAAISPVFLDDIDDKRLSLSDLNGQTTWNDDLILHFRYSTKLYYKIKMKFTDPLPYYDGHDGGTPEHLGTISQLDYLHPTEGSYSLFQLQVWGKNQTPELCSLCIPQQVAPVACEEKYADYLLHIATITGVDIATAYSEEEFCRRNLGYLVDSYKKYCEILSITSTLHPWYLTIAQFGDTNLNYGYQGIDGVLAAYKAYLDQDLSEVWGPVELLDEPLVYVGWNKYVDQIYLMNNSGICVPAPMMDESLPFVIEKTPCEQMNEAIADTYQNEAYNDYMEDLKQQFIRKYIKEAMETAAEEFTMQYDDNEYQYTLYYYDQAGNLTSTVAPEGVARFETTVPDINLERIANPKTEDEDPALIPNHQFKTQYKYNSLNQLVWQSTPDGGITRFAYDSLGRIIASQNARQLDESVMSYTEYDWLGRIVEAGEITPETGSYAISDNGRLIYGTSPGSMANGFDSYTQKHEVTKTFYNDFIPLPLGDFDTDNNSSSLFVSQDHSNSFNNRNRVTGVLYYSNYTSDTAFDNGIFYNYDIHGNVKELVNYYPSLKITECSNIIDSGTGRTNDCEAHLKRTTYDYDLISGNVKQVTFQPSRPGQAMKKDLFIHRYEYDADNRILNVQTSSDGVLWEKDADYKYYPHGPLARTEIGDKKVQGIDYAYTLHGWLKAVNGEDVEKDSESTMGNDRAQTTGFNNDAFGYSLSYYNDEDNSLSDYKPISNNEDMLAYSLDSSIQPESLNLYNGNIKKMATAIKDRGLTVLPTQVNTYQYDQLNRIKQMNSSAVGNTIGVQDSYNSAYSYDKNGNIKTMDRYIRDENGGSPIKMDGLTYHYKDGNNQLLLVNDKVTDTNVDDLDLENQYIGMAYNQSNPASHNYVYDKIGQLTADRTEQLEIKWRADGKVSRIDNLRTNRSIAFEYDGLGNRIFKVIKSISEDPANEVRTLYSRDAQGNVLGVYKIGRESRDRTMRIIENDIYGSSRLGLEHKNDLIFKERIAGLRGTANNGSIGSRTATAAVSARGPLPALPPVSVAAATQYALHLTPLSIGKWQEPNVTVPLTEDYELDTRFKIRTDAIPDSEGDIFIGKTEFNYQENRVVNDSVYCPVNGLMINNQVNLTYNTATLAISKTNNALDASCTATPRLRKNGYAEITLNLLTSRLLDFGVSYASDAPSTSMRFTIGIINYESSIICAVTDDPNPVLVPFPSGYDRFRIIRKDDLIKLCIVKPNGTVLVLKESPDTAPDEEMVVKYFLHADPPAYPGLTKSLLSPSVVNYETNNKIETIINSLGTGADQLINYGGTNITVAPAPAVNTFVATNGAAMVQVPEVLPAQNPKAYHQTLPGDGYVEHTFKNKGGLGININVQFGLTFDRATFNQWHFFDVISYHTGTNKYVFGLLGKGVVGASTTFTPSIGIPFVDGDRLRIERRKGRMYYHRISAAGIITTYGIMDLTTTEAAMPLYLKFQITAGGTTNEVYDVRVVRYLPTGTNINTVTGTELKVHKTVAGYSPKIKTTKQRYNMLSGIYTTTTNTYTVPAAVVSPLDMEQKGMEVKFTKTPSADAQFIVNNATATAAAPTPVISTGAITAASAIGPGSFDICYFNYKFGTGTASMDSSFDFTGSSTVNPITSPSEPTVTMFTGSTPLPAVVKEFGPCMLDQDHDGIYDIYENVNNDNDLANDDTDGDGIPNYLDPDDDGDDILTMYEVPNTDSDFNPATGILANTDNDAWPNYLDNDDDGDTVLTIYEINNSDNDQNPNTGIPLDTDGDGIPNYLDVDDDNDGYATWEPVETDNITDTDGNPYTNPHDSDNDGIVSHLDPNEAVFPPNEEVVLNTFTNFTGDKQYELSNHLGNVLVVVSDKKIPNVGNGILKHYLPEVVSYSDYDPFGSLLPGRHGSAIGYRYGFNGKEKDDELKGEGNSYNFEARMLDPRIGRWFAVDPLAQEFPNYSPYLYCENNPVNLIDPTGMSAEDPIDPPKNKGKKVDTTSKLDGWNKTVNAFNKNFNNKVDSFFSGNPISQVSDTALDFLNGTALTVGDLIPGLTQAMGIKNNTANAIGGVIDTAIEFPSMTNEKQGASIAFGVILIGEIVVTEKLPLGNIGRSGKNEKLIELATDPKLGKADKGWIKSEMRKVEKGNRKSIRNPPGKDLAHERGREAAKGYSYKYSNLQDRDLHKRQHKYDNGGRKNKERPVK